MCSKRDWDSNTYLPTAHPYAKCLCGPDETGYNESDLGVERGGGGATAPVPLTASHPVLSSLTCDTPGLLTWTKPAQGSAANLPTRIPLTSASALAIFFYVVLPVPRYASMSAVHSACLAFPAPEPYRRVTFHLRSPIHPSQSTLSQTTPLGVYLNPKP